VNLFIQGEFEMGRPKKRFRLKQQGRFWYYKLQFESTFHSTGKETKTEAEDFIFNLMKEGVGKSNQTFKIYSRAYYLYDIRPNVQRLLQEGKSVGKRHCVEQRRRLEKYIFPRTISQIKMNPMCQDCCRV